MKIAMAQIGAILISALLQSQPAFTRSVRDGIYTSEQAARGQALYSQYCASCHMADLQGTVGPTAPPRNTQGWAPALRGREFISHWDGLSVGDLFERIRVSMPQSAPGSLSRQQNADILAFILQENGYALGLDDLSTSASILAPIRFEP